MLERAVSHEVILLGAGNAHLLWIKRWAMDPWPDTRLTLINETGRVPYSGMVPGLIGGNYTVDEVMIDLVALCSAAKVSLIVDKVTKLDAKAKELHFAERPRLKFDVLSLNMGSRPSGGLAEHALPTKPLLRLVESIAELEKKVKSSPRAFSFAVIGGGGSGAELALAIAKRFRFSPTFRVYLIHAQNSLLPKFPSSVHRKLASTLKTAGVEVLLNTKVTSADGKSLQLSGGKKLDCDSYLLSTQAEGVPVLRNCGLDLDERGFVWVKNTLASRSEPSVFGAGDCVTLEGHSDLPKSGVYAVRMAPYLFENVRAHLNQKPLKEFIPQRRTLAIFNTADGQALLTYGKMSLKSKLSFRLKDYIDRRWMTGFEKKTLS